MRNITHRIFQLLAIFAVAFAMGACSDAKEAIADAIDDDDPNDGGLGNPNNIDNGPSGAPAKLDDANSTVEVSGALQSLLGKMNAAASVAASASNESASRAKIDTTVNCSQGNKVIDGDTDGNLNFIVFQDCFEDGIGLGLDGRVTFRCEDGSSGCPDTLIFGNQNSPFLIDPDNVSFDNATQLLGSLTFLDMGGGTTRILSDLAGFARNSTDEGVSFLLGGDSQLQLDITDNGSTKIVNISGTLGFGNSSQGAGCGDGQVTVSTTQDLLVSDSGRGRVTDGSLSLSNADGQSASIVWESGQATITANDGNPQMFDQNSQGGFCDI